MAWTAPTTLVTGTIIASAWGNTDVRDNSAYLKGLLDGTGADNVTFPVNARALTSFMVGNADDNFRLLRNGSNPQITLDSGSDFLLYDRSNNELELWIAAAAALVVNSAGKLTGAGFYDSGALTIANGANSDLSHGLGARPRFVFGVYNTTNTAGVGDTSTTDNFAIAQVSGSVVSWGFFDNTTIRVTNSVGVTAFARVWAML